MDEGDEYVPQISQIDYTLIDNNAASAQSDVFSDVTPLNVSTVSATNSRIPCHLNALTQLQHVNYSNDSSNNNFQLNNDLSRQHNLINLNPQLSIQQQQQQQQQKPKTTRRRKNTVNIGEQMVQEQQQLISGIAPGLQSNILSNQGTVRQPYMTTNPMQNMTALSQNPMMSAHMRPINMQQQQQQPAISDINMRNIAALANDPYSQQQQHWYQQQQQYRPNHYHLHQHHHQHQQIHYGHRASPPVPSHQYYQSQQHDPRMLQYYQNYQSLPRYPNSSAAVQPQQQQQYYVDQGYYGRAPQSNHLAPPSGLAAGLGGPAGLGAVTGLTGPTGPAQAVPPHQQQQPIQQYAPPHHDSNEWHQQQQQHCRPQQNYSSNIQIEIQQVQQQLQSMYDMPNRNLQASQQIEQLQLRLQYLQRCSMTDFRATPQKLPEQNVQQQQHQQPQQQQQQPVSVMQRGSEVQVNIKPDVPGHTLISVYHQYPSSATQNPQSHSGNTSILKEWIPQDENGAFKDCIPPEPIPSSLRTSFVDSLGNNSVNISNPIQSISNSNNTCSNERTHSILVSNKNAQLEEPSLCYPAQNMVCSQIAENETSSAETARLIEPNIIQVNKADSVINHLSPQKNNREQLESTNPQISAKSSIKCKFFDRDLLSQTNESIDASKGTINEEINKHELGKEFKEKINDFVTFTTKEKTKEMEVAQLNDDVLSKMELDTKLSSIKKINENVSVMEASDETDEISQKEYPNPNSLKREEIKEIHEEMVDVGEESLEMSNEKNKSDLIKEGKVEATASEISKDESQPSHHIETDDADERNNEKAIGIGSSKQRNLLNKKTINRKRKQKDSEISDDVEDDEFIPESKRPRKPVRRKRKEKYENEAPVIHTEKRRSGRTLGAERKSYNLQAKWDEMDEEIGDSDGEAKEMKKEEQSEFIIDKIISIKRSKKEPDKFYVKYKNKSYIHCEWKNKVELESGDKRAAAKIKRFLQKRSHSSDQEEEHFNSDFIIVERVLDMTTGDENSKENEKKAFVKWRSLPYEDATWETIDLVPKDKLDLYKKYNTLDQLKVKPMQRPSASEWRKIPEDLAFKDNNTLRDYQFEGVNWLLYCYFYKQNCILADEMGLGKTVQTICFLQRLYDYGLHGPFLIVVPLSTVHNWQREFGIWTDMNTVVYHGSAASRQLIQENEFYYRQNDNKLHKKSTVKFDALITTFEMIVSDCELLRVINYRVCVIDEAHRLKNRNCKLLTGGLLSFSFEHRVLLTGTPLQNNIEELYSLLNFLEPEQFHSSASFLEQFGECQTEDQVSKLQEILRPMMLRRLKEDVEKTLQPKEETIIEIQLSNTQKKYYRAILERNFSHLCKGSSMPSLMNAMMELRKCCNHPFLINGAEDQILSELKTIHPDWSEDELYQNALVQSSGKLVLISKLLPKLRADGHKVLIFSQMVRVLDIIEEYLVTQNYTFERIDGNVRGDLRQTAIDRFSKKDSDRFVFLLCTRAGGLGINLTAADTVIIFDSDWNPQNDLQAQARCHRIGQTKMVKVYRLITSNTYEREMFDKASLKLGLDKAVLQSTTALKDNSQQLSRKEVEELLKKGAYGAIMEESNEESKFNEEDIETILLRRTTTITLEAGVKGSTFAKASFNSSTNREDIDIDDPNFWSKWAKKANIDTEFKQTEQDLIVLEPRNRKKRFEENVYKSGGDESGEESDDDSIKGRKRGERKSERKKRNEDDEYRPDELAFNKSEYFRVERLLAQFGWGRWKIMKESSDLKEGISESDIEHISRTLLLHCIREYRGDEKIREFVWRLIIPKGGLVMNRAVSKKRTSNFSSMFHEGWAALPEFNPPAFAVDSSFQRHIHRHSNKLLSRMHQLHILNSEIIGSLSEAIMNGTDAKDIGLIVEINEAFVSGWDAECDKSFLIGVHKHGFENYETIRNDQLLCFHSKNIDSFPSANELFTRFRKLLTHFQRKRNDSISTVIWSKREEAEFMRVLRSYGVKDDPSTIINWTRFRQLSPLLEKKSDGDLMEELYCVLSMCTKQLGSEMTTVDQQRAMRVEAISTRKAHKLMQRMNFMRQIHDWAESMADKKTLLKLCSSEAMPSGWSVEQDEELFAAVDSNGLDNISGTIANHPAFQSIIRPEEKTLLRRIIEIFTTLQTKKWNGAASTDLLEDSDDEQNTAQLRVKRGRKKCPISNGNTDLVDSEKEKMRALAHQSFLQRLEQLPLAAAVMAQSAFLLPHLLSSQTISQQALSNLFGFPNSTSSGSSSSSSTKTFQDSDSVLNLSMKDSNHTKQAKNSAPTAPNFLNNLNFSELFAIANLSPETRVPVVNIDTGVVLTGDQAPKVKNLGQWLSAHPKYVLETPGPSATSAVSKTPNKTASVEKIANKRDISASLNAKRSSVDHEVLKESMNDIKSCSKLEPGEIPKALSSSKTASSSLLEASDQSVTVYQRSTGIILAPDKWPSIKNLQLWLDKHPDCNVHSSSIHLATTVLPKSYADRLGGEPIASSLSHAAGLEALQMHMMLQQSLMNQSLLGLGAYGPVNPYAMLAAASVSTPSVKASSKDILNPVLNSLINPSTALQQLQQMQSLLTTDSSLLLNSPSSMIGSSNTSSSLNTNIPKASSSRKSTPKGRLNAVVEKLASSQS